MMITTFALLLLGYVSSANSLVSQSSVRTEEDFVVLCEDELRLEALSSEVSGDRYCSAYLFGYLEGYKDANRLATANTDKKDRNGVESESLLKGYVKYVKGKSTDHKRDFRISVREFMKTRYGF